MPCPQLLNLGWWRTNLSLLPCGHFPWAIQLYLGLPTEEVHLAFLQASYTQECVQNSSLSPLFINLVLLLYSLSGWWCSHLLCHLSNRPSSLSVLFFSPNSVYIFFILMAIAIVQAVNSSCLCQCSHKHPSVAWPLSNLASCLSPYIFSFSNRWTHCTSLSHPILSLALGPLHMLVPLLDPSSYVLVYLTLTDLWKTHFRHHIWKVFADP